MKHEAQVVALYNAAVEVETASLGGTKAYVEILAKAGVANAKAIKAELYAFAKECNEAGMPARVRQCFCRALKQLVKADSAWEGLKDARGASSKASTAGKGTDKAAGKTGATMTLEMDKLFGADVAEFLRSHAVTQGAVIRMVKDAMAIEKAKVANGKAAKKAA